MATCQEEGNENPSQNTDMDNQSGNESDVYEERFRVDRRKLESMIQDGNSDNCTAETFFDKVMKETDTQITWPSKLKIGAKSKKDPHIKVAGEPENVQAAKEQIMSVLDTKSTRVTLKMDVSHTEHSHVIGKGGNNIKQVMQETGCHIHFPDSNRNTQTEKSNQVSIAGQPDDVELARRKIRELLPLVFMFELPVTGILQPLPDASSPPIKEIQDKYNVSVTFKQKPRVYSLIVIVRGSVSNAKMVQEAVVMLFSKLMGSHTVTVSNVPVSMQLEIAPQHHLFIIGHGGANIKHIMQQTGASINFPDPTNVTPQRKGTVYLNGPVESVYLARCALLGCLPLVLMFDMKDERDIDQSQINKLMEHFNVFISVKPKPKQTTKSVIVKSIENNASNLHEARKRLLGLNTDAPLPPIAPPEIPIIPRISIASLGGLASTMLNINTSTLLTPSGFASPLSPHNVTSSQQLLIPNLNVASRCLYQPALMMVPRIPGVFPTVIPPHGIASHNGKENFSQSISPNGDAQQMPPSPKPSTKSHSTLSKPKHSEIKTTPPHSPHHMFDHQRQLLQWQKIQREQEQLLQLQKLQKELEEKEQQDKLQRDQEKREQERRQIIQRQQEIHEEQLRNEEWKRRQMEHEQRQESFQYSERESFQCDEPKNGADLLAELFSKATAAGAAVTLPKYMLDQITSGSAHSMQEESTDPFQRSFTQRLRSPPGLSRSSENVPLPHHTILPGSPRFHAKQMAVSFSNDSNTYSSGSEESECSECEGDHMISHRNMHENQNLLDILDYERKKLLATKAMQRKPEGESRTPTDYWAGMGFSKSMPDAAIREKLNAKSGQYQGPSMGTFEEEGQEEDVPLYNDPWAKTATISPQSSFNGSLRKSELNIHTHNSEFRSDFKSEVQSDSADCNIPNMTLAELFSKLGLGKYTDIFSEQEIDLGTFLTMNDDDLRELGITTFGARRKMLIAIRDIGKKHYQSQLKPITAGNSFMDNVNSENTMKSYSLFSPKGHNIASQSGQW